MLPAQANTDPVQTTDAGALVEPSTGRILHATSVSDLGRSISKGGKEVVPPLIETIITNAITQGAFTAPTSASTLPQNWHAARNGRVLVVV